MFYGTAAVTGAGQRMGCGISVRSSVQKYFCTQTEIRRCHHDISTSHRTMQAQWLMQLEGDTETLIIPLFP